jgi:hypothetical protein
MKLSLLVRLFLVIAGLTAGTVVLAAENLNAVRARMEQRLGSLNELKDRGAAGENNRGYLEARGAAQPADQKVIADENADRRTVRPDRRQRRHRGPATRPAARLPRPARPLDPGRQRRLEAEIALE